MNLSFGVGVINRDVPKEEIISYMRRSISSLEERVALNIILASPMIPNETKDIQNTHIQDALSFEFLLSLLDSTTNLSKTLAQFYLEYSLLLGSMLKDIPNEDMANGVLGTRMADTTEESYTESGSLNYSGNSSSTSIASSVASSITSTKETMIEEGMLYAYKAVNLDPNIEVQEVAVLSKGQSPSNVMIEISHESHEKPSLSDKRTLLSLSPYTLARSPEQLKNAQDFLEGVKNANDKFDKCGGVPVDAFEKALYLQKALDELGVPDVSGKGKDEAFRKLKELEDKFKEEERRVSTIDNGMSGFAAEMRFEEVEKRIHKYRLALGIENPPYTPEEIEERIKGLPPTLIELIKRYAPADFWVRMQEHEKKPGYSVDKTIEFEVVSETGIKDVVKRNYYDSNTDSFDWERTILQNEGSLTVSQYYSGKDNKLMSVGRTVKKDMGAIKKDKTQSKIVEEIVVDDCGKEGGCIHFEFKFKSGISAVIWYGPTWMNPNSSYLYNSQTHCFPNQLKFYGDSGFIDCIGFYVNEQGLLTTDPKYVPLKNKGDYLIYTPSGGQKKILKETLKFPSRIDFHKLMDEIRIQ